MAILKKYFNLIEKLYKQEESGLALALFRIAYGLVVFFEVYQIFYFRHLIFDPMPYVEEAVFLVTPALVVWLFFIFLIVIGLYTRLATFLNYLFSVLFLGFSFGVGAGKIYEYHIDTEFLTVGLVLMFMPLAQRFSLDRLIQKIKHSHIGFEYQPKESVSSMNYIILIFSAGVIYFDSIFFKASSPMWLEGLGVWLPSSLPWAVWLDLSFLLNQEYLIKTLGYVTLIFQATYIFFVWFKKTKVIYLLIGIALHIGIFFAYPIPWFALAMIALYIGIIPSSFYSNLYMKYLQKEKKPTLSFFYDENCPLCNRLRIIVEFFDNGRNISFLSAQTDAHKNPLLKSIQMEELLDNVYSIDIQGQVYKGIATYVKVLNKIWIFKPIGLLMYLPFIRSIGEKLYIYIAEHRIRYGCTAESCEKIPYQGNFIEQKDEDIKILQNLNLQEIKVFVIASFILFFTISQLIILQKSPLIKIAYTKIHMPLVISESLEYLAKGTQYILYPITGFESHGVFMDEHFKDYSQIYNIYYLDKNNDEVSLSLIKNNGLVDWMNTSRQWRYWTFSTIGSNKGIQTFYPNIERIIHFWAYKNNIDLYNAQFKLKLKEIDVIFTWEKDLLKNNMQKPWKEVGALGWKEGVFYTDFLDIEKQK